MPRIHEQSTGRRKLVNPQVAPCNDRNNNTNDPQNAMPQRSALNATFKPALNHRTCDPANGPSTPAPCGMLLLMRADSPCQPNTPARATQPAWAALIESARGVDARLIQSMATTQQQSAQSHMWQQPRSTAPRDLCRGLSAAENAHSQRPPRSPRARARRAPCPSCPCAGPHTPTTPPRRAEPAL